MSDAAVLPFTLLFFWIGLSRDTALTRMFAPGNTLLLVLIDVLSVAAGAYLVAGRFVLGAYSRAHTRYAVTDRAAYVARFGVRPAVRRHAGAALDSVEADSRPDGRGTIRFMPSMRTMFRQAHPEWPDDWSGPVFTREARAARRKSFFASRPRVPAEVRDAIRSEWFHEPTLFEFYDVPDVRRVLGLIVEARANGESRLGPPRDAPL